MPILCIETSCDETAAAVVEGGRTVLSSIVASQAQVHAEYGGVVPEIASRKHMEAIIPVVDMALKEAGLTMDAIEGIGVTQGPGLVGALLVGVAAARAMAVAKGIPSVGVNHIEGHILAILLEEEVPFPFIALAVSGGHSHLYRVEGIGRYTTLGKTIDDAAGEAFDKVAKLLGLPYPGGVLVDRLSLQGDDRAIPFPRPLLGDGSSNFSFSGLKTAVMQHLRRHPSPTEQQTADICASFQAAVCQVLVQKTVAAAKANGLERIVMAGGVACNSRLRVDMATAALEAGLSLHIPSLPLCADNAAMLGVAAQYYLTHGIIPEPSCDVRPVWPLDAITKLLAAP
jgi:N6-L-threonylcarbamoyladenine synthase